MNLAPASRDIHRLDPGNSLSIRNNPYHCLPSTHFQSLRNQRRQHHRRYIILRSDSTSKPITSPALDTNATPLSVLSFSFRVISGCVIRGIVERQRQPERPATQLPRRVRQPRLASGTATGSAALAAAIGMR